MGHGHGRPIDRDWELNTIEQALEAARRGIGTIVFVDGPSGVGRSHLLSAAARMARTAEAQVQTAVATELESGFRFGVAIQLLEPVWLESDPATREALVHGPAGPARELLTGSPAEAAAVGPDEQYPMIHALYWASRNLVSLGAERDNPAAVLIVDDLNWADPPSTRFLAYLGRRIAELPLVMIVAVTSAQPAAEPRALAALRTHRRTVQLGLAPLAAEGVTEMVRRRYPAAGTVACATFSACTAGNPTLVEALLDEAERAELTLTHDAPLVADLLPRAVIDGVRTRLDGVPALTRAVAIGAAVLGDQASVGNVAAFADVDRAQLAPVIDALCAGGVIKAGVPLRFLAPLVQVALLRTLTRGQRSHAHARAAAVLSEAGAGPSVVAPHLLATTPGSDVDIVELLREHATIARGEGDAALAVALLERAIEEHPPAALRAELVPQLRTAMAQATWHDTVTGLSRADLRARARLAWGDGELLRAGSPDDLTVPLLIVSLIVADDIETVDEILAQAAEHPIGQGAWHRSLRPLRAWNLYLHGRVEEARALATESGNVDAEQWPGERAVALTVLAYCLIAQDDLAGAEATIASLRGQTLTADILGPACAMASAELALAQRRPQEALDRALEAGAAVRHVFPGASPAAIPWRSAAAAAHIALGASAQAQTLIGPDLEEARRLGVTSSTIRGLRLLGLAVGGEAGVDLLTEAAEVGDSVSLRLEHVRALVDLGAALRRANQRSAAREPLSRAVELANRFGMTALAAIARTELNATGARPRRLHFSGVESLTVSQRRVAELAARGLTTRQIAEALFVTPKTVEFHLRHAYRKLDICSRAELTAIFAAWGG
jgi:DNA-binding CsgD family transcriptional regulator